jgi:hypothetical protein
MRDGDTPLRQKPESRAASESKLRKDGRHCPICLKALAQIAGKGRRASKCTACHGQPRLDKRCAKCHQAGVWESETKAACQACGVHGSKVRVIAGALQEKMGA